MVTFHAGSNPGRTLVATVPAGLRKQSLRRFLCAVYLGASPTRQGGIHTQNGKQPSDPQTAGAMKSVESVQISDLLLEKLLDEKNPRILILQLA
ncbi:Zinc Finger Protein 34 [Manis pentadactyla]|nr:Zinc Finger Protein 34 [Manis pentadactyla]